MKINPLGAEWFQADRRTDRHTGVHTDMTKKIVIFSSFANEHKSCQFGSGKEIKHNLKQSWKIQYCKKWRDVTIIWSQNYVVFALVNS